MILKWSIDLGARRVECGGGVEAVVDGADLVSASLSNITALLRKVVEDQIHHLALKVIIWVGKSGNLLLDHYEMPILQKIGRGSLVEQRRLARANVGGFDYRSQGDLAFGDRIHG